MIYYSIPFSTNKNIGEYYNAFMNLLPNDNDFACFIDGDAMFTVSDFGRQLNEIIESHPTYGVFTCITNRVGSKYQLIGDWENDDINYHRKNGKIAAAMCRLDCIDITNKQPFSGVMILISKAAWKRLGGFKTTGMLGVDTDLHLKCKELNEPILLMKGVYLYHWYRGGNRNDVKHLI